jgi:carboxylesterase type B
MKNAMLPFFSETGTMSEDCLNLRIARPIPNGTTFNSKLPVVVWVHGGGVVKGSAYDLHSEPDKLVTLSESIGKPIIFVAINYRLTAFGFARLPILEEQRSLNVGLRDQREAMQWVKDNIEAFGGDPDKITVFGLSAGGTFLSLHLMAYAGKQGQ